MGPYCNYCNRRCFVHIPANLPAWIEDLYEKNTIARDGHPITIIATCADGQAFEKQTIGVCYADIQTWLQEQQDAANQGEHHDPTH